MKKGIAVFYDPHNVYQFLWYYSSFGKDTEWIALCLPNSFKGDQVSKYCKKLGIFKKIYISHEIIETWNLKRQIIEFIKLFFYALIGKQTIYAEKYIAGLIDNETFDESVVLTDCGFVSGMFLVLGKEKQCTILEDGIGDYLTRKYSNLFRSLNNTYAIKGFIMAVLGYVNFSSRFPLRTTKNCIKFSSHPEKMSYKKYKEIKTLFALEHTDMPLFQEKLSVIYPEIEKFFEKKPQAILFTVPLTDFADNADIYYKKLENYIDGLKFQNIILKKHPRDRHKYNFNVKTSVVEVKQEIPAEVLLPYLKDIEIYFMCYSSINLYMEHFNNNPKFFYFSNLNKETAKIGCAGNYFSIEKLKEHLTFWNLDNCEILKL